MVWSPPSKPVQQISQIRFWPGSSSENESNESREEFTEFPLFRPVGSRNTEKPCFGRRRTEAPTVSPESRLAACRCGFNGKHYFPSTG
jgi:hypothetical protein